MGFLMSNEGKMVKVHYKGTLDDGTQFDSSYDRGEPLSFVCGSGHMIKGFDEAVKSMNVGDTVDVHLACEDAYGPYDEDGVQSIPHNNLRGIDGLDVGDMVTLSNKQGYPIQAKVVEIDDSKITFDLNHPLAGQPLNFQIELLEASDFPKPGEKA